MTRTSPRDRPTADEALSHFNTVTNEQSVISLRWMLLETGLRRSDRVRRGLVSLLYLFRRFFKLFSSEYSTARKSEKHLNIPRIPLVALRAFRISGTRPSPCLPPITEFPWEESSPLTLYVFSSLYVKILYKHWLHLAQSHLYFLCSFIV